MKNETVLILDFGGQYKELIARRVRENGVYSVIRSNTISVSEVKEINPVGIIFTGGPNSVYAKNAPTIDKGIIELGIPVLGICYGMQLLSKILGGNVGTCVKSEYGLIDIEFDLNSVLFKGCSAKSKVLMSHTDMVTELPSGLLSVAKTELCPNAGIEYVEKHIYGVQFHPEVENSPDGNKIISNFLHEICHVKGGYSYDNYLQSTVEEVKEKVGSGRILMGFSGGVSSVVCATLLQKAVGDRLTCIYIDHGFMRKNENDYLENVVKHFNFNLIRIDASKTFINALKGVTDPEEKRKIIGKVFADIFEETAKANGGIEFLAQGTINTDVVESGKDAAVIKSHHNVGGLPNDLNFKGVVEPLRRLFKDEVRKLGAILGLPENILSMQPFPGPGLAIRILDDITEPKLSILREADSIFREELSKHSVFTDQAFAVLTNSRTVGVMGDGRTYDYTLVLRAINTNDYMTAGVSEIPFSLLLKVSNRITNEVKGINRVVYDITSKPPATIEWE